jgi:tRNA G18 (ribose-2'-O)-methylase SpoU
MFNVHDYLQTMTVDQLQEVQRKESLPFAVAAVNLSGDLNISNMLRSAVVFGASKFIIIGKRRFDRRGCVGAQNYIELVHYDDDFKALEYMLDVFQPVFIEQGGEDLMCQDFYGWNRNPCLIFGSESYGLPKHYFEIGEKEKIPTVSIDQVGIIRSLNVASAAAITMWKVAMDLRTPRGYK